MSAKKTRNSNPRGSAAGVPAVSAVLDSGTLVELVYDRRAGATAFAIWSNDAWHLADHVADGGRTLVPYSADNGLMRHNVVLFPSRPATYGSQEKLVTDISAYIRRYVGVSKEFERLTSYYVLLTWVFDQFNELPYLRVQGGYGTGKTRFLQIVGSLCYRPIFANGASTVSPIFHMLDALGGTLIVDEADLRFSDEKADMVKIFNNGNVRGMPVLRSDMSRVREYDPRVFNVFGPKIVAMRGSYDDAGLESRFFTEVMDAGNIASEMPISLPLDYQREAQALRDKLLLFRFENCGRYRLSNALADRSLSLRVNQMLAPLLAVAEDCDVQAELREFARRQAATSDMHRGDNGQDDYRWIPLV